MKVVIKSSYERDIKKIKDAKLARRAVKVIDTLIKSNNLFDIKNIKKLKSERECYRVRLGSYRMTLEVEDDTVYVIRFLYRDDNTYNKFP